MYKFYYSNSCDAGRNARFGGVPHTAAGSAVCNQGEIGCYQIIQVIKQNQKLR